MEDALSERLPPSAPLDSADARTLFPFIDSLPKYLSAKQAAFILDLTPAEVHSRIRRSSLTGRTSAVRCLWSAGSPRRLPAMRQLAGLHERRQKRMAGPAASKARPKPGLRVVVSNGRLRKAHMHGPPP